LVSESTKRTLQRIVLILLLPLFLALGLPVLVVLAFASDAFFQPGLVAGGASARPAAALLMAGLASAWLIPVSMIIGALVRSFSGGADRSTGESKPRMSERTRLTLRLALLLAAGIPIGYSEAVFLQSWGVGGNRPVAWVGGLALAWLVPLIVTIRGLVRSARS
jgi:hypothetical protein